SQEEILEELFSGTAQGTLEMGRSASPEVTQTLASESLASSTIDIQPSQAPRSQMQRLTREPLALVETLSWPKDKPQAEIVFAQSICLPELERAALWVMLHDASHQQNALPLRRIELAVEFDPHPMLAWITVLHDQQGIMRCLPCYLDLVDMQRRHLIQQLVQQRSFLFLLFDPTQPSCPVKVDTVEIDARQQRYLHQTVVRALQSYGRQNSSPSAIAASKSKLKSQYAALKAKLPQQLALQAASTA
ncbi:MAG: hypothetical protein AAGB01_06550, partial [Cyanobacteria bacterium P01_F01_bin.42]